MEFNCILKIAILYNTSEYLVRFRSELIRSLHDAAWDVVSVTPFDDSTAKIATTGSRWREWQLDGQGLNPFRDICSIIALYRILVDERPDAILCYTIKPVLYGSIVGWLSGSRSIVSVITGMGAVFQDGSLKRKAIKFLATILYRAALYFNKAVFFQNDEDQSYFRKNSLVSLEKARKINGSGVNLEYFAPSPSLISRGSFVLISRMIEEKGIIDFVEAARIIKSKYKNAKFVLVGPVDNNPGALSRDRIIKWEEEGLIEYVGQQADIRPFLASAEVYVLPSYYMEGVPRSILEALSMGKPIITTDWRGCRDTVIEGYNGFLIPPKRPDLLSLAMERFLSDSNLSTLLGRNSRELAMDRFDVRLVNENIIRELDHGRG